MSIVYWLHWATCLSRSHLWQIWEGGKSTAKELLERGQSGTDIFSDEFTRTEHESKHQPLC
jgi:hypothetical protein